MKAEAKPIRDRQEALKNILDEARKSKNSVELDFSNTEIHFHFKCHFRRAMLFYMQ